jgi:hypothetical protein
VSEKCFLTPLPNQKKRFGKVILKGQGMAHEDISIGKNLSIAQRELSHNMHNYNHYSHKVQT